MVAIALVLGGLLWPSGPFSPPASAARTIHVSTGGNDGNDGSSSRPLRTIEAAVSRAASGDTIELRGGVYRESVQVYRKALHLRSRSGERAILDGSVPVSGWKWSGGDWFVDGWTTQFQSNADEMVPSNNRAAGYPDQVFIGDRPLRQVLSRSEVAPGTFFHDTGADRIWIGEDPGGRQVDVSNRSWAIYLNDADGSRLTNITVRRYGTERRHIAAIRAYADDLVVDGVVAEDNAAIGISVIGRNVTVRNGRASGNGYLGVHADRATNLRIEAMSIVENNLAGFDPFHSAGGFKATTTNGITILSSDVSNNRGPGIWTDIYSSNVIIAGNRADNNDRSGIEIELTDAIVVAGNATTGNREAGIWILESADADVWHNASFDNEHQVKVEEGPRKNVQGVRVNNNILGRSSGGGSAMLDVNDWTEDRSAAQMGVTSDGNLFWRTAASPPLSRWGRWPSPLAVSNTLGDHRSQTGQGANSAMSSGGSQPARKPSCGDFRAPSNVGLGVGLNARAAHALAASPGARLTIGPPAAVEVRMLDWPTSAIETFEPVGGGLAPNGMRRAVRMGPSPVTSPCG